MKFRLPFILLVAVVAAPVFADESKALLPSAPIPSDAIWDANAWEPESGRLFWGKPAAPSASAAPAKVTPSETAPVTASSPFSSRQSEK